MSRMVGYTEVLVLNSTGRKKRGTPFEGKKESIWSSWGDRMRWFEMLFTPGYEIQPKQAQCVLNMFAH